MMNSIFKWLGKVIFGSRNESRSSHSRRYRSRKETISNQKKILWEASGRLSMPDESDKDVAWMQLERAIDIEESKQAAIKRSMGVRIFSQPRIAYAMAAIILVLVFSPLIYKWINFKTFITDPAEQLTMTLPDGSEVQLNYASQLSYRRDFDTDSREVSLVGEAYFEVQKSPVPFIVNTDGAIVQVVGTRFNVWARQEGTEIAVNQGEVEVKTTIDQKDSTVTLTKGQYSNFEAGEFPQKPQDIPFKQYPGWIHGVLIFNQTNLNTVCIEIERKFGATIELANKDMETITVTGIIEAQDLKSALSTLSLLIKKQYQYKDEKYIIY